MGGVFQNGGHLVHLHHKGGLAGSQVVRRAHSSKDGVYHANVRLPRRYKGTDLRQQGDQRDLAHIGGLTCHIGAGDNVAPVVLQVQVCIVGNKGPAVQQRLHHRVAAVLDLDHAIPFYLGTGVVMLCRHMGQGTQHIQPGQRLSGHLQPLDLTGNLLSQSTEQLVLQRHLPILGA